MPPLNELTSVRALVEFQQLRSDMLAEFRPFQLAIVTGRLAWARSRDGWRQCVEDVTQEAQLKLCTKLHRADEWTVPAEAVAARCANDAATEFIRRTAGHPAPASSQGEEDPQDAGAVAGGDEETVWEEIALPELVARAVALATRAGSSLQDARLWAWGDVVDRRFRLSGKELAEQFAMRANAAYQGVFRTRQKVLVHLIEALDLSADEAALLANDMRAKNRLDSDRLAKERDMTVEEVEQVRCDLRVRVADYLGTIEADG